MRKKILIIEEDKDVSALFGKALDPRGFDVYAIGTPDKGIEKAIELEPDVIFIDLIFQESNGLKVSKLLHSVEKLKDVPIVMLISHKSDLDPKYTSTIGVVDTLVMPLEEDAVLSKTLSVLGMDRETSALEAGAYELPVDEEPDSLYDDDRQFEELVTDQQEFVTEADRLIEQAILKNPGEKTPSARLTDGDLGREDNTDEKTELPGAEVVQYPDFEAGDEPLRKDKTLNEDEQGDWKDDRQRKTFKDEFEDEDMKMSDIRPAYEDSRGLDEDEGLIEKADTGKKKLLIAAAVLLTITAAGLGAYQARRYFFPPETVKAPAKTAPVTKEVVKESLPPADAIRPAEPVVKKETPPAVKPEDDKKPPVQEKSASTEKTGFKFSIQAGYFENRKNADSLTAGLKEKGYDAFVLKSTVSKKGAGSRTFHRVLIGRFDNIKKAEAQAQTLRQKEGLKVIIYRSS